ncbi:MAG: UDP-glucose 6-dehydrogenase, partial [Elusimicrobia bacterium]|nr:UDP-glucose 6-dehydrogenase [Elusimicrobiota bacterium]
SFKPETDDMRFAQAVDIISKLQAEGARIKAYDPIAVKPAKKVLTHVQYCKNAYETAKNSDALLILTEWNEFRELDLIRIKKLLRTPVIVDGRNIYDPVEMKKLRFVYKSIGRI